MRKYAASQTNIVQSETGLFGKKNMRPAKFLLMFLFLTLLSTAIAATPFTSFRDLGYSGVDIDWSGDGNLIVIYTYSTNAVVLQDPLGATSNWNTIQLSNLGSGRGVVFSPDSKKVFFAGMGNPQDMAVYTLNYPDGPPIESAAKDDDGRIEYRACDWDGSPSSRILVGRTNDPECRLYYTSLNTDESFDMPDDVMAVAFDKTDPSRFVFGSDSYNSMDNIKAGDTSGNTLWTHWTFDDAHVRSVAWYGSHVVVGDENGKVYRYSTSGSRLDDWAHGSSDVTCAEFSPDGQWLATCGGGGIKIWDTSSWTEQYSGPSATCVAWDPTSTYLVDNNGKLYAPFQTPPSVELTPYKISDTSGTPDTNNPGNEQLYFKPGETVRVTLRADNTGSDADVLAVLNIREPDDTTIFYDSHDPATTDSGTVEDNSNDSPLTSSEGYDYYSFDKIIPLDATYGSYDIGASIRNLSNWDEVWDTTASGRNDEDWDNSWLESQFTVRQFGTTIITHGFHLGPTIDLWEDRTWIRSMGEAIAERAERATIWLIKDGRNMRLTEVGAIGDPRESILLFDWLAESDLTRLGYSEAAGDSLFASLMEGARLGEWSLDNLHFIGNSRGCVVNSMAIRRIAEYMPSDFEVGQVTTLDPHPVLGTDPDNTIYMWDNVIWADNYWREDQDGHGPGENPDFLIDLNGEEVAGAYDVSLYALDTEDPDLGYSNEHRDVHLWYHGTIDTDPDADANDGKFTVPDEWYDTMGPRDANGFYFSRLGGGIQRPEGQDGKVPPGKYEIASVFNGEFTCGDTGWGYQGGGGEGEITLSGHLRLYKTVNDNTTWRRHNRFFIPDNATTISFKIKIEGRDLFAPFDRFEVLIGEDIIVSETTYLDHVTDEYKPKTLDVVPYRGSVTTLTFRIVDDSGGTNIYPASQVWIDNVSLMTSGPPIPPITPEPSAPEDDATVLSLTPEFEWSIFQDGGDGETQVGYQLRVRCDTDGDIIVYDTGFIADTSGYTHTYSPGSYSGFDPVSGANMVSDLLEWDKHYHWHVRYCDSDDDWSGWSADDPNAHQDFYTQSATGSLRVTITPQAAIDAGAQWRVDGGTWQISGYTQTGLPVGQHTVEFKSITDWNKPGNETVQINYNQTTTTSGTYVQQTGSLQVTISPQAAIDAGAQWRVDGGTWQISGYTQTGLPVGSHTVEFKSITDWNKPGNKTVQINYNQTTTTSGTYVPGNHAPVLEPIGNKSVNENALLTFSVNATDPDGDPITYSVQSLPSGATLDPQTGDFAWTPSYEQAGSYQVTFIADDGQAQDSETITITVINVNRPPVLTAIDNKSAYADVLLTFTIDATDPDADTIIYSSGTLPSGATFTGQTFDWTPSQSQEGSYAVPFFASDGQLQDSETVTITVGVDSLAPTVTNCLPTDESIQVPLNNLISLHITDAGTGIDAATVTIEVNGNLVYTGDTAHYNSLYGDCRRLGTKADYRFVYQSNETFYYDQTVTVIVNATDLAGHVMNEYSYSFATEMRSFGQNKKVNSGLDNNDRPVTVCDSSGNIWAAWHAGPIGNRDIYVSKLAAGEENFGDTVQLTGDATDQCNPAVALDSNDKLYVVWQDNRQGDWDIYLSTSIDGINWSSEIMVHDPNDRHQVNPDIVIDSQNNAYVVWQDDREDNQDIFVATSSDGFVNKTVSQITSHSFDQVEPAVTADSANTIYVVWMDGRNSSNDIYGAASNNGWTNVAIVSNTYNQSNPAIATESTGSILHLLWVDDRLGDNDIYYASSNGLLDCPLTGSSIIDEPGTDQLDPTIAVTGSTGNNLKVFACWQDWRNTDTDLYFVDPTSGSGTNVFVGDDGSNAYQSEPVIGIDEYDHPYLIWADSRSTNTNIYYAGSTFVEPVPLASELVLASDGATVGTDPASINDIDDVSVVIPAGACWFDVKIKISKINNHPSFAAPCLGGCDFGPSGIQFSQPVTITIPYAFSSSDGSATPYWFNLLSGTLSKQGITDVQDIVISPTLHALSFKTTHFTAFYLLGDATFTLNVSVYPEGSGSVTKSPNKDSYSYDENVTLKAVANTKWYSFRNWSGDVSSTEPNTTIIMDSDKSITANFVVTGNGIIGDFCGANSDQPDGYVDYWDLLYFAQRWHSSPSDTNWDPRCDLAKEDNYVDYWDLLVFAQQWHKGEKP